jgi:succinate dehydrogenase / fumarate reductase iron-sulfur subunit
MGSCDKIKRGMEMKKALIKILRTHHKKGNQFWQSFEYEGDMDAPISFVLDEINSREKMIDTNLDIATPILWDRDCEQSLCGNCAMVINRIPRLACSTILSDVLINGEVEIRPLTKFRIIADLKVDRTIITDGLKNMNKWLENEKIIDDAGVYITHEISKCLACGCCLEACPNYSGDEDFVGAMNTNLAYLTYTQENDPEYVKDLKKKYKKKFYNGCSKSLICEKICPVSIPEETDMSNMKSLSVWRIWQKK